MKEYSVTIEPKKNNEVYMQEALDKFTVNKDCGVQIANE